MSHELGLGRVICASDVLRNCGVSRDVCWIDLLAFVLKDSGSSWEQIREERLLRLTGCHVDGLLRAPLSVYEASLDWIIGRYDSREATV